MEIIDESKEQKNDNPQNAYPHEWYRRHSRTGRVLSGMVVIGVGAVLLAHQLGVALPFWLFTWPMLLIVIGIYIGAKHEFSRGGWFVPIIIGCVFLVDDVFPDITIGPMIWPIIIIAIGLMMILRPYRKHRYYWKDCKKDWKHDWRKFDNTPSSTEDTVESTSIFGGVKKNIISKDFKGGEITCIFGGAEINLSQADINGKVVLEMTQVFGGTKLIVPSHWNIQTEITAVLGGIEDKRPIQKDVANNPEKTLLIRGTSIFGGIEINSY